MLGCMPLALITHLKQSSNRNLPTQYTSKASNLDAVTMARRHEPNLPPGFLQDFRGATIQSGNGGPNGRGGDIGSHNIHTVFNAAGTHNHGFQLLAQAACPSAFHDSGDSYDRPKCHPETRLEVQREIKNWTKNPKKSVKWVSGGPGVGKSAIARTMAEMLAKDGRLAACFCFSRTDSDRNCIKSLAATIAYHAVIHIPQLESDISRVVERNPLIFDHSFETQFRSLIAKPFGKLAKRGYFTAPSCARVVIIDGLDECVNKNSQLEILNSICSSLERGNFPLLFLIASRREPQLLNMFENGAIRRLLTQLNLDTSFSPDNDIRVFLKSSFNNINKTHHLSAFIPQPWPHPHAIATLVGKSSGQFIYASLVVKYVSSLSHLPHQRLDIILGLRPVDKGAPFAELDELYTHILKSVHDDHIDSALMKGLMGKILELDPGQLQIVIGELGSTLKKQLCTGPYNGKSFIALAHASFGDYLCDKSRSKSFYLDQDISHSLLASSYLRLLMTRRVTIGHYCDTINTEFSHHCFHAHKFSTKFQLDILNLSGSSLRDLFPGHFYSFMGCVRRGFLRHHWLFEHFIKCLDELLMTHAAAYCSHPRYIFLAALSTVVDYPNLHYPDLPLVDVIEKRDKDDYNLFLVQHYYPDPKVESNPSSNNLLFGLVSEFMSASGPIRSGKFYLDADKYSTATLYCLQCICDLHEEDANRIIRMHSKRHFDQPFLNLLLEHLPMLLRKCGKSTELLNLLCEGTLAPVVPFSQYQMEVVQKATEEYVQKWDKSGKRTVKAWTFKPPPSLLGPFQARSRLENNTGHNVDAEA